MFHVQGKILRLPRFKMLKLFKPFKTFEEPESR
jgi:hypothetical protein